MSRLPNYWLGLELRHLEVLQAIAERGTFWAASESLDCSPSAVSQLLGTLEKIVGHRLVERSRGRRRVHLTEAGRLLLRHADAIVARLRAAHADLDSFTRGTTGLLRVGTYQSVGSKILPALLRQFTREWPAVEIRLVEGATDEILLNMIERGELDLTYTGLPLPDGPFEGIKLMEDPFVLLVARDSPLSRRRSAPGPSDLAGLNLITLTQSPVVAAVEGYFRRLGATPRIVFRTDDNGTMQGLVSAGVGAAIAPLLTVDSRDKGVRIIRLAGFPARILALAWHRDRYRSPAQQAFIERARQVCAQLAVPKGAEMARPAEPKRLPSRRRQERSRPPARGRRA